MLLSLPPELQEHIFSYIEASEIRSLLLLGFSSALFTRLYSSRTKFIHSSVLERLTRLREVKGYILLYERRKIVSNVIYYLKSLSISAISPFLGRDVTLISSSPCRCRMIQLKGEFILLYNSPSFCKRFEKDFPYVYKKERVITLGKRLFLPVQELVKVRPELENIIGLSITTLPLLSEQLSTLLTKWGCMNELGISVERFPLCFYRELALLSLRKRLGSYLTQEEFKMLVKYFCQELDPLETALLHSIENYERLNR